MIRILTALYITKSQHIQYLDSILVDEKYIRYSLLFGSPLITITSTHPLSIKKVLYICKGPPLVFNLIILSP